MNQVWSSCKESPDEYDDGSPDRDLRQRVTCRADSSVQGADVKSMPVSPNGLSSELNAFAVISV